MRSLFRVRGGGADIYMYKWVIMYTTYTFNSRCYRFIEALIFKMALVTAVVTGENEEERNAHGIITVQPT